MICGFDTSMRSIAGAAIGYDGILRKKLGPEFVMLRWNKEDHYFDRLLEAAKSFELVLDLQAALSPLIVDNHKVYIAQEEPWPFGMVGKSQSIALKQQAEISGAFLGSLVRYGYNNIYQINNTKWRQIVAEDLGISIHYSKWNVDGKGKWRSKEWSLKNFEVPDWPDLIETKKEGLIPRPENSKARAKQPDDRYDALAIMEWMRLELGKSWA